MAIDRVAPPNAEDPHPPNEEGWLTYGNPDERPGDAPASKPKASPKLDYESSRCGRDVDGDDDIFAKDGF